MTTGVTRLVLSGTAEQPSRELVLDGRLVIARAATPFGSTEARAVIEDVRAVGTRRVHQPWLLVVGAVSCLFLLWHARTLLAAIETSSSELEVLDDLRVWAASVFAAIGPILTYLLTRHVVLAIGTQRRELTVALRGDESELKDASRSPARSRRARSRPGACACRGARGRSRRWRRRSLVRCSGERARASTASA